jgi:hypothetical protein
LVDTRDAASPWVGRTERHTPLPLRIDGLVGLPARTGAVALNLTATDVLDDGFATIYPCAGGLPATSNLNFKNGQTVANAVLVGLGDGNLCLSSTGRASVIIDLTGVFFAADPAVVGVDSGVPSVDSGVPGVDAGVPIVDGGGDAGVPTMRGSGTDGGTLPSDDGAQPGASGCGCSSGPLGMAGGLTLLFGLLRARRR